MWTNSLNVREVPITILRLRLSSHSLIYSDVAQEDGRYIGYDDSIRVNSGSTYNA